MSGTKTEDCNESKIFDELKAHQFDCHTTEGLLESLSSQYNEEDYLTKMLVNELVYY